MMKFTSSEKIREARLKKNYSQEYVAFALGISQKSYSDIENAKTLIHQKHVEKLCALYLVEPKYFCNLACRCKDNKRLDKLLEYLKENNIAIPPEI